MNVLIVEDCPVMRLIIKRTFKLMEFYVKKIFEASDGINGLEHLENEDIGFIIIDINMPIMDGVEMLKIIQKHPKFCQIPILTVSAESNRKRIALIENLSGGFIHKPFTPEMLNEKILKLLPNEAINNEKYSICKPSRKK